MFYRNLLWGIFSLSKSNWKSLCPLVFHSGKILVFEWWFRKWLKHLYRSPGLLFGLRPLYVAMRTYISWVLYEEICLSQLCLEGLGSVPLASWLSQCGGNVEGEQASCCWEVCQWGNGSRRPGTAHQNTGSWGNLASLLRSYLLCKISTHPFWGWYLSGCLLQVHHHPPLLDQEPSCQHTSQPLGTDHTQTTAVSLHWHNSSGWCRIQSLLCHSYECNSNCGKW